MAGALLRPTGSSTMRASSIAGGAELFGDQEPVFVVADHDRRRESGADRPQRRFLHQRPVGHQRPELFWKTLPRHRPQPRAGAAGEDNGDDALLGHDSSDISKTVCAFLTHQRRCACSRDRILRHVRYDRVRCRRITSETHLRRSPRRPAVLEITVDGRLALSKKAIGRFPTDGSRRQSPDPQRFAGPATLRRPRTLRPLVGICLNSRSGIRRRLRRHLAMPGASTNEGNTRMSGRKS